MPNAIASRIAGTVIKVTAENDQPVQQGQLLIELDPRDQQVTVEQDRAQYEQALAKLASDKPNIPITNISNTADVATDRSNLVSAQAALDGAQKDYESNLAKLKQSDVAYKKNQLDLIRYTKVHDKHELADADFDSYVTNANSQAATVESNRLSADSSLKTVDQKRQQLVQYQVKLRQDLTTAPQQVSIKKAMVDADQASVDQAKAALDSALLNLSYCKIVSPVNGIATQRNAELGARVNAAQQVLVVVQTDNIFVTANFKETQLRKMHPGQPARIHVDALGRTFDGEVEFMPAASGDRDSLFPPENATGNYVKVVQRLATRIKFKPGQRGLEDLRPGMSVEPKVHLD